MAAKSVLIVGGGVIGLCVAWYAVQRGHRVTLLERGAGPDHDSCSLGNAGMVVPSHFIPLAAPGMVGLGLRMMRNPRSPFYIRPRLDRDLFDWGLKFVRAANAGHVERSAPLLRDLNLQSRAEYEALSARLGGDGFGLEKRGLLMLCKTEHALEEEARTADMARRLGVPAEVLTPAQAAETDPYVKMDVAGAVYFPLDCHLSPQRFVSSLTRELRAAGADLRFGAEVTGWRTEDGRVLAAHTTENGAPAEHAAAEFVIAGGAWSPGVVRGLGLRLPMQAGKGYSVTLQKPRRLPRLCSILTEARVAVTPMGETLRFGGTMEIAGNDLTVRPERVQGILDSVPRYFPEFTPDDLAGLPAWSGLRPCSPDGLPYVGRFRRWANLSAATGHAMMGLSLAPVTGRLLAELLSGESPSVEIAALSPDRYA